MSNGQIYYLEDNYIKLDDTILLETQDDIIDNFLKIFLSKLVLSSGFEEYLELFFHNEDLDENSLMNFVNVFLIDIKDGELQEYLKNVDFVNKILFTNLKDFGEILYDSEVIDFYLNILDYYGNEVIQKKEEIVLIDEDRSCIYEFFITLFKKSMENMISNYHMVGLYDLYQDEIEYIEEVISLQNELY